LISIGEVSGPRQFESHLAFASAGLNPVNVFQTNQPQTLLSLVKHGLGTGVTNALAVATANLDGGAAGPDPRRGGGTVSGGVPAPQAAPVASLGKGRRRDPSCSAADLAGRPGVMKVHRMNWSTKSAPRPFAP
jgi:DNA-binding transcriptional LysR family regulator